MVRFANAPRMSLVGIVLAATLLALLWENHAAQTAVTSANEPLLSPPSGYYAEDVLVSMRSPDPAAKVLFTTDGSLPTVTNAAVFQQPLPLDAETAGVTVVKARLQWEDGRLGPVTHHTYFQLDTTLPILSLAVDPTDLTDPETGIFPNRNARGMDWEKSTQATFLETMGGETAVVGFDHPVGLRLHGNASRGQDKKSFRIYFRSEYGQNRLVYPLFEPLPYQDPLPGSKRIVIHGGGQEHVTPGWTLLRTPLLEWLGAHTHVTVVPSRPVLLFINGESQGIYLLRQRIDDWYFSDINDVPVAESRAQDIQWQELWLFFEASDMRDPDAYDKAIEQINVDSFIDYHLLQLYAANTDWIYSNVQEYRPANFNGQWQWLFWDLDWVFGLATIYSPDFDMMSRFFDTDDPNFLLGSIPLQRLMENPQFRQRFLERTDELLNTILRPDYVLPKLDEMALEIAPDIAYEYSRWPKSSSWEAGLVDMRHFIEQRPFHFRNNIEAQFGLAGSVELTLAEPAAGSGQLAVGNWLTPPNWTGRYFEGTTVQITAVPDPGYQFAGWQEPNLPNQPVLNWSVDDAQRFTPRFERLADNRWQAGDVRIMAIGSGNHPELDTTGDWVELQIARQGGVDLRGWRLTDADTKTAVDEGSLSFANLPELANVPNGTRLLVVQQTAVNETASIQPLASGLRVLSVSAGQIDDANAHRFHLAPQEGVALLAPGETADLADDVGIAFHISGIGLPAVTPATFGILADGVTTGMMEISSQTP